MKPISGNPPLLFPSSGGKDGDFPPDEMERRLDSTESGQTKRPQRQGICCSQLSPETVRKWAAPERALHKLSWLSGASGTTAPTPPSFFLFFLLLLVVFFPNQKQSKENRWGRAWRGLAGPEGLWVERTGKAAGQRGGGGEACTGHSAQLPKLRRKVRGIAAKASSPGLRSARHGGPKTQVVRCSFKGAGD